MNDLIAAIAGSVANLPGKPSSTDIINTGILPPSVTSFLNGRNYNGSLPRAYINGVLFDERSNYVSNCSGFEQVGSSEIFLTIRGQQLYHIRTISYCMIFRCF